MYFTYLASENSTVNARKQGLKQVTKTVTQSARNGLSALKFTT